MFVSFPFSNYFSIVIPSLYVYISGLQSIHLYLCLPICEFNQKVNVHCDRDIPEGDIKVAQGITALTIVYSQKEQ